MRSATLKFVRAALTIAVVFHCVGCQKKCQQPPQAAFQSITDTDWRLVDTNDPNVSNSLSNFTFLIWHFDRNFTGSVSKVINNDKYNNPVYNLVYNVNTSAQILRIQFFTPSANQDPNNPNGQAQGPGTDAGTYDYQYTLSNELDLYDQTNGYYYRFVPFTGIVNPDEQCTF